MLLIHQKIFRRAKIDIRNCPFNFLLFQTLHEGSLSAQNIFQNKSKYLNQELMFINRSSFIKNKVLKLMKIVELKREVDGQGLTSKVSFKPIGRQVTESLTELFRTRISVMKKLIT